MYARHWLFAIRLPALPALQGNEGEGEGVAHCGREERESHAKANHHQNIVVGNSLD
jgi:hypothetical protein